MASVQILNDFFALGFWQSFDFFVQAAHTVIGIHTQFFKQLGMLFKSIFVENLYGVTEHDWMRNLHHGCLHVQGQHHASLISIFDFFFIELAKCFFAHIHAVDDFAS